MNSNEIIKVVDCLIGKTNAIGDTSIDENRYERLKVLIDLTNWCVDGVIDAAKKESFEWSVKRNSELAQNALSELIDVLKDVPLPI